MEPEPAEIKTTEGNHGKIKHLCHPRKNPSTIQFIQWNCGIEAEVIKGPTHPHPTSMATPRKNADTFPITMAANNHFSTASNGFDPAINSDSGTDNVFNSTINKNEDQSIVTDYDNGNLNNNILRRKSRFGGGESVVPPSLPNVEASLGREVVRDVLPPPVDSRTPSSVARINSASTTQLQSSTAHRPCLPLDTRCNSEAYDRYNQIQPLPSSSKKVGFASSVISVFVPHVNNPDPARYSYQTPHSCTITT